MSPLECGSLLPLSPAELAPTSDVAWPYGLGASSEAESGSKLPHSKRALPRRLGLTPGRASGIPRLSSRGGMPSPAGNRLGRRRGSGPGAFQTPADRPFDRSPSRRPGKTPVFKRTKDGAAAAGEQPVQGWTGPPQFAPVRARSGRDRGPARGNRDPTVDRRASRPPPPLSPDRGQTGTGTGNPARSHAIGLVVRPPSRRARDRPPEPPQVPADLGPPGPLARGDERLPGRRPGALPPDVDRPGRLAGPLPAGLSMEEAVLPRALGRRPVRGLRRRCRDWWSRAWRRRSSASAACRSPGRRGPGSSRSRRSGWGSPAPRPGRP